MAFAANAEQRAPQAGFANEAERKRLSGPGLRTFFRIADAWDLTGDEQRNLLGGIARSTLGNWKGGTDVALARDQLERVSLVLGIYKAARLLFADGDGAKRWFRSANTDYAFAGMSPLERMLNGGISDLYAVRRYLDAWRGVT
ncbi:MAG TPA: MbcA/ParS/Xre antitoxin family protein [Xanthobacteraceae bacterium]